MSAVLAAVGIVTALALTWLTFETWRLSAGRRIRLDRKAQAATERAEKQAAAEWRRAISQAGMTADDTKWITAQWRLAGRVTR